MLRPILASATALACALSLPATARAAENSGDHPAAAAADPLDAVVVTASPLARSSFDLATPVSQITGTALRLKLAPTLGETLRDEPGVHASGYTVGASRPIIRGLADNRVLVLQNGADLFDVSSLSPDHAPSVQPFAARAVEVVRGPATILYGSSAIGGVVNVLDGRIPTEVPIDRFTGELDGRATSATLERSTYGSLDVRVTDHLVLHLDGTILRTDNVRVPSHALSDSLRETLSPEQRARGHAFGGDPEHLVPNTSVFNRDFGVGLSYVGARGYLGVSFSQYLSRYGVPDYPSADDPVVAPPRVTLDVTKRQFQLRSSLSDPFAGFKNADFKLTYTDYHHQELDGAEVGSIFRTHGLDTRIELLHQPIGGLTGSVGAQFLAKSLGVFGEEAFLQPTETLQGALFVFEEARRSAWRLQFGARVEGQQVRIDSASPTLTSLQPGDARTHRFLPLSAAAGVIRDLGPETNAALTLRYSERAPTAEELFARGPHDATFQYLIGQPDLPKEKVLGLDLALRRTRGRVTGSIGAFYNHFFDFIDFAQTGASEDGLEVFQYADKRADFLGGEAQATFHFLSADVPATSDAASGEGGAGKSVRELIIGQAGTTNSNPNDLFLELRGDYVHAQDTTEGRSLGRIPPLRYGATLGYQSSAFGARLELQRVERQNSHAALETSTPGYTFLNASLNYTVTRGLITYDFYLRGTNLTDAVARDHTSFLKDVLPLAGRSITLGLRASF